MENIVEIRNVTKSFGPVRVLNSVSLSIKRGIILGLAGGNGAGKSTLAQCLTGHHKIDSGEIVRHGQVAIVPQEFKLIPVMRVYENLFLGRELKRHGFLDRQAMIRQSAAALEKLDGTIDPNRRISELSVAQKQKVELAKAVLFSSNLLIMDEPTTVLNHEETDVLFSLLRAFRAQGGSVVYISHRLRELTELCDEIAVMRDGDIVFHGPAAGLTPQDIAQKMIGKSLDRLFPPKTEVPADAENSLEVSHLSSGSTIRDISFVLKKGEILGLTGLAGAGRTELAETVCGMRRKTGGEIRVAGRPTDIRSMHDAHQVGISYLSEDRQGTALLLNESLMSNTVLASLASYAPRGFIRQRECKKVAESYIEKFHIKADGCDAPIRSLSGGNQQKVAIAKGLDTKPHIFVFDEPTRGVDVGARSEIYGFIHDLARSGVSCLLISSDLEEVIGNCTRTLVMRSGELAGELESSHLTEAEIMYYATGVN